MKNLIIILVTVLFVTSCTPPPPDTSSLDAGMEMFNKNKEIADKTFDLFIAKDLEGM